MSKRRRWGKRRTGQLLLSSQKIKFALNLHIFCVMRTKVVIMLKMTAADVVVLKMVVLVVVVVVMMEPSWDTGKG